MPEVQLDCHKRGQKNPLSLRTSLTNSVFPVLSLHPPFKRSKPTVLVVLFSTCAFMTQK